MFFIRVSTDFEAGAFSVWGASSWVISSILKIFLALFISPGVPGEPISVSSDSELPSDVSVGCVSPEIKSS